MCFGNMMSFFEKGNQMFHIFRENFMNPSMRSMWMFVYSIVIYLGTFSKQVLFL